MDYTQCKEHINTLKQQIAKLEQQITELKANHRQAFDYQER